MLLQRSKRLDDTDHDKMTDKFKEWMDEAYIFNYQIFSASIQTIHSKLTVRLLLLLLLVQAGGGWPSITGASGSGNGGSGGGGQRANAKRKGKGAGTEKHKVAGAEKQKPTTEEDIFHK